MRKKGWDSPIPKKGVLEELKGWDWGPKKLGRGGSKYPPLNPLKVRGDPKKGGKREGTPKRGKKWKKRGKKGEGDPKKGGKLGTGGG